VRGISFGSGAFIDAFSSLIHGTRIPLISRGFPLIFL